MGVPSWPTTLMTVVPLTERPCQPGLAQPKANPSPTTKTKLPILLFMHQ
jgi:hypothetical protein